MLVQQRLLPLEGCKPTSMQECMQELPRKRTRTGRELLVIEQLLEETGQPVGRGLSKQSMDKPTLRSGTKKILDMFLNLPSHASWNPGGRLKSERHRADEARKRENEAKMSEMSREGTPPWIHDRYEACDVETLHLVRMIWSTGWTG